MYLLNWCNIDQVSGISITVVLVTSNNLVDNNLANGNNLKNRFRINCFGLKIDLSKSVLTVTITIKHNGFFTNKNIAISYFNKIDNETYLISHLFGITTIAVYIDHSRLGKIIMVIMNVISCC